MDSVVIFDNYDQPWRIEEDDQVYEEAKAAVLATPEERVHWPLSKIVANRGWGWWTVFKKLDEFERDLEQVAPNPGNRLIDIHKDYTVAELRELLQQFGGYTSSLIKMKATIEAQCLALKQGLDSGLKIAMASNPTTQTSITGKEAEVMAGNPLFKQTKKMQIENEAMLAVISGWVDAYKEAWWTVNKLLSVDIGEMSMQSNRHY